MNETQDTGRRSPQLLLAAAFAVTAGGFDLVMGEPFAWGRVETLGFGLAAVAAAVGWLAPASVRRATAGLCMAGLVTLLTVGLVELTGRLAQYDFSRGEAAYLRIPTYFRQARVPVGDAYFRRNGPQQWRGQVLNVRLDQIGIVPNPYADEEPVVADYDADGFRNPVGLEDWEVVVVGDSFTELGYLNHEDLFTTRIAEALGVRVKNLGVSQTGALSQACYVEEFGFAPSTRHLVVVFFINDLLESSLEHEALMRFEETGVRELREGEKQTSALRHLRGLVQREPKKIHHADHATFGPDRIPVSVYFAPRHPDDLEPDVAAKVGTALDLGMAKLSRLARERGITPWVVYMPCKGRVHYGQLEFTERVLDHVRDWEPSRLPDYVRERAAVHGLRFLDLSPALIEEAQRSGELLYNSMYDMHLNRRGSHLVAEQLTEMLRAGWDAPPLVPQAD